MYGYGTFAAGLAGANGSEVVSRGIVSVGQQYIVRLCGPCRNDDGYESITCYCRSAWSRCG